MTTHMTPRQCLGALSQEISDGGRSEYLEREDSKGLDLEPPEGDCAIVATVYATFKKPSWWAYQEARFHLGSSIQPRVFNRRDYAESTLSFVLRRIKQVFRPHNREPMHGTPNQATLSCLRMFGYQHIYPNAEQLWYCICDQHRSDVVDTVAFGVGHTICVQQGTVYSTIPLDPEETEVLNVLALGPDETADFRAQAQHREDHEAWLDEMITSGNVSWDWSSEPKLEDYLMR